MFIAYRCEECIHAEYLAQDNAWECMLDCSDDKECWENYEDDSSL